MEDDIAVLTRKDRDKLEYMFRQMVLIRKFEEKIGELFTEGVLFGTTHAYIGQEAVAVGVINTITRDDIVTSNHRGHGHFLTFTNDVNGLMNELMGKSSGVCGGRGGSQHLHKGSFYSNGITAGMTPVATGMALAEKIKRTSNIVVCFLGDGALGQGVVYESMNMASLWGLPILYVIENNFYAMSTRISQALAGSMKARAEAFGIETQETATNDVIEITEIASSLVNKVRKGHSPEALICNTYRLCGHSKSDDLSYRAREEEEEWRQKDPLKIAGGRLSQTVKDRIMREVERRLEEAVLKAQKASFSKRESLRRI